MGKTKPHPLAPCRQHLRRADQALTQVRTAKTFDNVEDAWTLLLQELHTAFNKLEVISKQVGGGFQPWVGQLVAQRRTDPLLSYMLHARNSHEHSLQEITARRPGSIGIGVPSDGPVYIKSLRIAADGRIDYEGSPVTLTFTAPRFELLRVLDRGKWYDPPTRHLDRDLTDTSALHVAQCGINFLRAALERAQLTYFAGTT